jgi:hypothetical protein
MPCLASPLVSFPLPPFCALASLCRCPCISLSLARSLAAVRALSSDQLLTSLGHAALFVFSKKKVTDYQKAGVMSSQQGNDNQINFDEEF